jgi:hypothetical protein
MYLSTGKTIGWVNQSYEELSRFLIAFGRSWIDPVGGSKQQPDPDELNRHAGHEHQESCPSGGCGGGSSQNEGSGNSGRTS